MIFTKLRRDIELARALLAEREEAVLECERAHARLRELYGIGRKAAREAQDACEAVAEATTSADPAAPVLDAPVPNGAASEPAGSASCPVCGAGFAPFGRKVYCSDRCRVTANTRRARERKGAAAEPEPEPVPSAECEYCQTEFTPRAGERFCSPGCERSEARDRRGYAVPGDPGHRSHAPGN